MTSWMLCEHQLFPACMREDSKTDPCSQRRDGETNSLNATCGPLTNQAFLCCTGTSRTRHRW